jgi:L-ascorbate metabolism protein UlaG (beta-lactamase superfamily)
VDFATLLIEHGADVNRQNEDGEAVLLGAVMSGEPDLVEALITAGAHPNASEKHYGRSVMHLAALQGHYAIVEHLIKAGAPVSGEDHAGNTPLDLAARYGHGDVADLLVANGADPDNLTPTRGSLAAQGELSEGEAVIWYLGHSGWAIKTRNHLLVFDYFNQGLGPSEPGLCNGHISTSELAGEKVTVFATHEHRDHFDPMIFEWRDQMPDVTYVLGCQPDEAPPYEYTGPREKRVIDGMKVSTIESNDTGVGYVVEVDGLVIFHAGDHANRQRDFSGPYQAEIDYLADRGVRPDVAFMPISGCGFGDQEAVKMGVHYALETLKPRVFMPMHAGRSSYRYHEFIRDCRDQFTDTQMEAPENRGDRFRYRDGRVS